MEVSEWDKHHLNSIPFTGRIHTALDTSEQNFITSSSILLLIQRSQVKYIETYRACITLYPFLSYCGTLSREWPKEPKLTGNAVSARHVIPAILFCIASARLWGSGSCLTVAGVTSVRGVKLITRFRLMSRIRMRGAISPLPHMTAWRDA
jgi:hypothetical protein